MRLTDVGFYNIFTIIYYCTVRISFDQENKDMIALQQQFLTTPSPVFEGPDAAPILTRAIERLAMTLKYSGANDEAAMSTVYALLNILYSHNSKEKLPAQGQAILIQENVIAAISKIACIYKSEKVKTKHIAYPLVQNIVKYAPWLVLTTPSNH